MREGSTPSFHSISAISPNGCVPRKHKKGEGLRSPNSSEDGSAPPPSPPPSWMGVGWSGVASDLPLAFNLDHPPNTHHTWWVLHRPVGRR